MADWDRVHGRLEAAEAGFREARAHAERQGWSLRHAVILENLVLLLCDRGDWVAAAEEARKLLLRALEHSPARLERTSLLATLAIAAAHAGRDELVEDALVRLESEPRWRIVKMGLEGLTLLLRAASVLDDERLRRRTVDVVRRGGPELFELAAEKATHGFFGADG